MASSIIHLAVTGELIKRYDFSNTDRLKFGEKLIFKSHPKSN